MKLKRNLLIGLVLLVGVAALIYGRSRRAPESSSSAKRPTAAKTVKRGAAGRATHWEPYAPLVDDVDPPGTARLEGQVIDSQDHGVGKATVVINSNPPRTTLTEEDGSFVFEKLITRQYKLRARAGSLVGGPIKYRVKVAGEPLIIRLRAGVTVDVKVVDGANRRPLAGAVVTIDQERARTNGEGVATFEGISSGYVVLAARAEGFGLVQKLFEVTESKTSRVLATLVLSSGAAVSGTVRDTRGQGVVGATVYALDMAKAVPLGSSPISYVKTDAAGRYRIAAVAAGTYRIVAHQVGLAPAQSEPLAVDGKTSRDRIDLVLEAGATFSGHVLDKGKSPVASATVKVLLASGSSSATLAKLRRTVTDQSGTFKLKGLPRRQFEALAHAEGASSAAQKIDLRKGDVTDATFLLTVDGRISGHVVDGAGKPLAEVQVTATGDFWGGAKLIDLKLRGSAQVMTDGGGAFRFSGLPEGKYQLRASRSMRPEWGSAPGAVAAKTGDTQVKLVLRADGGAKGVVVFDDGTPATVYTVNVGYPPTRPVFSESGAFQLSKLRPGKYDLTFSSPSFVDKTLRNVEIAPDRVADLGTITVARGRTVKGRVLDAEGQAVANATVVMGSRLVGDGSSLVLELGESVDRSMALRRTATLEDGTFSISAVGPAAYVIAAEHPARGRSKMSAIPAGTKDGDVELRLQPFGSVKGMVKLGEAPGVNVTLVASAGDSKQLAVVKSGDDGRYVFERLAAGKHNISAIAGQGATANAGAKEVVVVAGKTVNADISIEVGEIDLSVQVVATSGTITTTQLFLFSGQVDVKVASQVNQVFLATSKTGTAKMAFAAGGKPAVFSKLKPGPYSLCAIPITGNMHDPVFLKRLQANTAKLEVTCQAQLVAKAPSAQSLTIKVPPMKPLPE